jgi:hypothetical protein
VNIRQARGIISLFWVLSGGLLLVLISFQTILGKYGKDWELVWSWVSPLLFPILAMVIAVWSFSQNPHDDKPVHSLPIFLGTMFLSVFYMIMLWSVIVLEPLSGLGWANLMKWSSWYLGLFQGLVAAAVGRLFVEYLH